MLMNIDCKIIQSVKVSLTFDDNKTKEVEIAEGDLGYFEFNKNGARRVIEGKVIKVNCSNTTDAKSWYIVVDGSLDFSGQMERFSPTQILDCDIIQKHDDVYCVSTPNDSTRITDIRLCHGVLQVSNDGGYSWITPKVGECFRPWDEPPEDKPPRHRRKKRKPVFIEPGPEEDGDDDDDEYDDGYADGYEDGYEDGVEDEYDDEDDDDYDDIEPESYPDKD